MNIKYILSIMLILSSCNDYISNKCDDSGSLHRESEFSVGVAINYSEFLNQLNHKAIVSKQFNSFTPENIFKADVIHPYYSVFNWLETDDFVNYCVQNEKRIHGHTLIWHEQLPAWLLNYNGNSAQWELLFKTHIQTIVKRYKGKVNSWDVVNEAFNEDGTLRQSIWYNKLGSGYIERAFQYAHEMDSSALLFYNDFNLESNPEKRSAVLNFCSNLRSLGVPIHGIGMQMHISIDAPEMSQISEAFSEFTSTVFLLHISEMDVAINPLGKSIELTASLLEKQANRYVEVLELYQQLNERQQYGITIWGLSDKDSWLRKRFNKIDFPLLYDSAYQPKLAYCKFYNAL